MRRVSTAALAATLLIGLLPFRVLAASDQTITFTSTAPVGAAVGGATYTVSATGGGSGNPVVFSIDVTAATVCSISVDAVSFIGAGLCVIDANQAGDGGVSWNAAPQVQQSFTVAAGDQTIAFTSVAPVSAVVGGPTYAVSADATSTLPVALTIDGAATSVCSIAGGIVSFNGAGTCVIDANQAGNADWNAAPQVQQSFAVGKGSQVVNITSTAPGSAAVGGATYTVTATGGGSGNPIVLSIDATSATVCSIVGAVVSFDHVGTCRVDANQAGDADWNAAAQDQQSFAVGKGSQSISYTSTAPASAVVAGPTYHVTATGGASGNPVTFSIAGSSSSICSISGGSTVSFTGVGTCTIHANQAGNADWLAASQTSQSFAVGKGAQVITFTSTAPGSAVVGGATYHVTATGGASGNPVVFSIDSSALGACTILGSTVSFVHAGTCTIDADQAASADWSAAPTAQQAFAIGKGDQAILITSTAPAGAVVAGPTYDVAATGGASGSAVLFTIDGSSSGACTISGPTVSFVHAGTCTIDANQAGDADWHAAPQVQQSFAVGKGDQVITFTTTAPTSPVISDTYIPAVSSSAGLAVVLSIDPTSASICTMAAGTVTFNAVGRCRIDADQAGTADWNAATNHQDVGVGDRAPACPDAAAGVVMNVAKTGAAGCTDPDLDPLTYAVVAQASHGTASIDGTGTWTYTPALNYVGPDTFTLKANDTVLDSNVATITLTVTNLQDDARNDAFSVGPVDRSSVDVLANDVAGTGETGQPLTITAVTQGTKGRVATNGSTVTYDPIGCSMGSDLFTYTISDGRTTDTATVIVTISTPGQNGVSPLPVTDTPAIGFVTGSTMSAAVSMRLSWCGVAAGSTKRYDLRQGSNGVSFPTTLLGGTAATSSVRSLAVITGYAWAVRTIDASRRVGPWALSPVARILRIQDAATVTIRYSSGWHVARSSGYSGGTEHYTTARRASATVRLTNVRQFALVASRGAGRGSVQVWVDGVLVATVSERAGSTQVRRVLYARALTSGVGVSHTIRIVAAGNGRVAIDSLLALS